MFWFIVCLPKTCYGKCPLRLFSFLGHKKSLFVCVTHPLTPLPPNLFLCVLHRHLLSPRRLPQVLLIPNKGSTLELALGWETRLRECNVSVSIQAAAGNKYWHVILSSLPSTVCGQTFTSITAVREVGGRVGVAGETDTNDIFSVAFPHLCPLLFLGAARLFFFLFFFLPPPPLSEISPVRKPSPFQQGK